MDLKSGAAILTTCWRYTSLWCSGSQTAGVVDAIGGELGGSVVGRNQS